MCGPGTGGGSPGVGGSIPGGIGLGIGGGGMAASTGPGVPGAGEGHGGLGNVSTGLAPGNVPQSSSWGSSDIMTAVNLGQMLTALAVPALAPLMMAAMPLTEGLGMLPDIDINRGALSTMTADEISSQKGGRGGGGAVLPRLPSIGTTVPEAVPAPFGGSRGIRGAGASAPAPAPSGGSRGIRGGAVLPRLPSIGTTVPEAVPAPSGDYTAYNQEIMDQYLSAIAKAPSGGSRGIRGAGVPSFKQQQKQTADEWLAKYWKE